MNPTTTTRRDVLKLASALGIAGALPPTADRVAAVQLLDQEACPSQVIDPAAFATRADGLLGGALDNDWLGAINPAEHAAYAQAREVLEAMVSTLFGNADARRTYGGYEEAIYNFITGAYTAGVRHGAAYENLRRSVVGDLVQCSDCWGVGARDEGTCSTCGGTGTVALKA